MVPRTRTKHGQELTLRVPEGGTSPNPGRALLPPVLHAQPGPVVAGEDAAFAGLESTDADWVREQVAEHEAAAPLEPAQRRQLFAELVSIRQFAILERQEPLPPHDETNSEAPHE